ncbi:MAG TPA: hypothetical protein VN458_08880 [Solirubrobacterales bacterium]|nr:hypothetical protein [Solirubrobacterales bacterium]
MRAKELWRLAPRTQTRKEPKRAAALPPESIPALPPESIPSELQAKMVAAFERARAERLAPQTSEGGVRAAGDPRMSANAAAFLTLERERLDVATRLSRPYRRRGDRYRDLVLITELIRMEYEHVSGRAGEPASSPSATNGLHGDMPADWARRWGAGRMAEMGTAFAFYRDQCDRMARWLPSASRRSAAAAADVQRARIVSRVQRAKGGRMLRPEPLTEPESHRAHTWAGLRFPRRAAGVAVVVAAIGTAGILAGNRGGESLDTVSAPSRAVVAVPEAVAAVNERPHEPRSAGGSDDQSKAVVHEAREGPSVSQTELATSQTPHRDKPAPALEPAAAPAPTPAPTPSSEPQPNPDAQPDPKPGPVGSLPPPVGSLPPPGDDSGAGAG